MQDEKKEVMQEAYQKRKSERCARTLKKEEVKENVLGQKEIVKKVEWR